MCASVKLSQILHDREITQTEDARFLRTIQQAVLLALREEGALTEPQLRSAEEKLAEQYRTTDRMRNGEWK